MIDTAGATAVQEGPEAVLASVDFSAPSLPGSAWLHSLRDVVGGMTCADAEAEAIDRIRVLEELKAVCAAAQARESTALDGLRREREAAEGVPAEKQGQGLGCEIALARRDPANQGGRHLGLARALCTEMPHTMDALSIGKISEYQATVMARETAWLPVQHRRQVDELMSGRLGQVGTKRLAAEAKAHAQRLDQEEAVRHLERSVSERRVSVRPAPGGMSYLTALLPMTQAIAAYAALQRDAATAVGVGDDQGRTRDQIAADLLVERVTGQGAATAVPMEVHVVMTDGALMGAGPEPAWIPGQGPIPADVARKLLADPDTEVFLRRLYTRPGDGQLVSMDSRSRIFPPLLRRMILIRDDVCRTPWCEAPIRHADHVTAYRDGGTTSFDNGSGLCAQCNLTKERPGWAHESESNGLSVTTPTGHRYHQENSPVPVWASAGANGPPGRGHPAGQGQPGQDQPAARDQYRRWARQPGPGRWRPPGRLSSVGERRLEECLKDYRPAFQLSRLAMASALNGTASRLGEGLMAACPQLVTAPRPRRVQA